MNVTPSSPHLAYGNSRPTLSILSYFILLLVLPLSHPPLNFFSSCFIISFSLHLSLPLLFHLCIYLPISISISLYPFSLSVPASLCLLLSLPPSPISFSDSLYNSLSLYLPLSPFMSIYISLSLSLSPCFLIYPFIPPPSSLALIIENASAVESLAIIHVDAIAQITRVIKTNQPSSSSLLISSSCLPHESAFIVEILKKLFQWGSKIRTMEHLVGMVSTV